MDNSDRQAIEKLFGKLAQVEDEAPRRDPDSEAFIRQKMGQQPASPYYMAQTIVVQEQALNAAQARIEELEREGAAPRSEGGLLGSLFGGGTSARARGSVPRTGSQAPQPEVRPAQDGRASPWLNQNRGAGGGFLAGAAQTAMGVAGGVLLGNAIGGMFGSGEAQAADTAGDAPTEAADAGSDDGFDAGGDFGDMDV